MRGWKLLAGVLLVVSLVMPGANPSRSARALVDDPASPATPAWMWPVSPFRLVKPYVQPAHRYGAGHRGVDLEPLGEATVRAPAHGTIAFAGAVAGRPVVTIDHGDGLVTTLEPVVSRLPTGAAVGQNDVVGAMSVGGHATPGTVHFGVRLYGDYINPLALLGGVPRAVLLPCCD